MPNLTLKYQPLDSLEVTSEYTKKRAYINKKGGESIRDHRGIDLRARTPLDLYNAHDGEVIFSGYSNTYGNVLVIQDSATGYSTLYAHLSEKYVNKADQLLGQTLIGKTGQTGPANTEPHLHIEVIDPDISNEIRSGASFVDILGKGRSINPRQLFATAFPNAFPTIVDSQQRVYNIEGDHRANTLIANSRDNTLSGLAGTDTYYFPTLSGSDVIDDVDASGRIVIGNGMQSVLLSGNALPKTDSNDVKIEGVWSLSGFDLHQVGSDLVIVKSGADVSRKEVGKVSVKDFPFENSRGGFGITLGKTTDLRIDPNTGNKVSNIGYDSPIRNLPTGLKFFSRNSFKTADNSGFFTLVTEIGSSPQDENNPISVAKFTNEGELISLQKIESDLVVSSNHQYSQIIFNYVDSQTGQGFYIYPFCSTEVDKNPRNTAVGFEAIDTLGNLVSSNILDTGEAGKDSVYVIHDMTKTRLEEGKDSAYIYLAYTRIVNGAGISTSEQRLDKVSLERVGEKYFVSHIIFSDNAYNEPLYFENGNVAKLNQVVPNQVTTHFTSQLPKLRNLTPSEIISNRDLASGQQTTNPNLKKQILSFAPDTETNLEVLSNPNSVLSITGLDGINLETAKPKMSFPVNHHSQIEIHSSTDSDYTIDQLLNGEFDFAASSPLKISKPVTRRYLTAKQEDQILRDPRSDPDLVNAIWTRRLGGEEEVQKLMSEAEKAGRVFDLESLGLKVGANKTNSTIGNNSTDDDYAYYYGDYSDNDDAIELEEIDLTEKNYPFTVIKLNLTETESQTIIFSGVNATEVAKMPEAYFLTQLQLSQSPTSNPSGNPSQNPSSLPSGKPTLLPSGNPSALPSGVPSFNPSGIPSSLPSGKPSSIPSHNPTAGDLIMPSSTPSFKPIGEPTSLPSKESKLPTGQPSYSKDTSDLPTSKPSIEEFTSQPSNQKSNSPSSSFPSSQPSNKESQISENPSISPSSNYPTIANKNSKPNQPQSPSSTLIGGIVGAVALAGLGIAATVKFLNRKGAPDKNKVYVDEGINIDIEGDQRAGRGGGR